MRVRKRRGITWPTVAVVIFVAVVAYIFTTNPQYARDSLPVITGGNWWWVALGGVGVVVSFYCQAATLLGLVPRRIPMSRAALAQVAAAASKIVAPAASGVVGLNARFLTKHDMSITAALTTVAATQVAQVGTTLVLVVILAPIAGVKLQPDIPYTTWGWIGVAIIIGLVGFLLWQRRRHQRARERGEISSLQKLLVTLRFVAASLRSPKRLALIEGGSLLLTFSLAVCMWAMVHAVGGEISFLKAAVIMMVGSALGSVFPTPGGVGGVEAAMTTLFLAAGTPYEVALPAVIMFRLMSFWAPAPFGALAALILRRSDRL